MGWTGYIPGSILREIAEREARRADLVRALTRARDIADGSPLAGEQEAEAGA